MGAGATTSAPAAASAAWRWDLPKGFPAPRVPKDNPMTRAKVALGRHLFYDTRLSGNGTQSCSSCHMQRKAFTDGRAQAVGSTGQMHPRGALSLANVAYSPTLTWANPALTSLESQMLVPLFSTDPVELGVTDRNKKRILARLSRDARYRVLFRRAYPGTRSPVTWNGIVKAIASFQRTLVSGDSRYDRYLAGRATLGAAETRGMNLFFGEKAECFHCHSGINFNDQFTYVGGRPQRNLFHNTGLYNLGASGAYPEPNRGVFEITGRPEDMGAFRAPTLRNIAVTAPYMHDGSIPTLKAVLDFYAAGGRDIPDGPLAGDGRANPYKDPLINNINLDEQERADIVAFLKTLTDKRFLTNPKQSNPFRRK
ncbi:MAG: MbnH family di-heme enzyme [Thermoleophilia bacterium]